MAVNASIPLRSCPVGQLLQGLGFWRQVGLGAGLWVSLVTGPVLGGEPAGGPAVPAGAGPEVPAFAVVERGPHHRVWERVEFQPGPEGRRVRQVRRYVELATGLHYWAEGRWQESREAIEPWAGGAVARQGPYKVIFGPNLARAGAIELELPDGQRLRSHVLGLSYYDAASGRNVLIAEVRDCSGVIVEPNQVVYADAFEGLRADVRYTYSRAGFEQDLLLWERPLGPEAYGLDPASTRLQVWTEFVQAPVPRRQRQWLGGVGRRALVDETLDWGSMHIGLGHAFGLGEASDGVGRRSGREPARLGVPELGRAVRVGKQWVEVGGRQFLVEEVPWEALPELWEPLPVTRSPLVRGRSGPSEQWAAGWRRLPEGPRAELAAGRPMALAQRWAPSGPAVVLDYRLVPVSWTNFVFQGDTTYYLSGPCSLYGTTVLEGGAVLKYARNASLSLTPGPGGLVTMLDCRAEAYRPVVLTAVDDDSVGEILPGSTGNPTGTYASVALGMGGLGPQRLQHVRFLHAATAVSVSGGGLALTNVQFVRCGVGVRAAGGPVQVDNALFAQVSTNLVSLGGASFQVQQATFHAGALLVSAPSWPSGSSLTLTNCILAELTALSAGSIEVSGSHNGFYHSPQLGVFRFLSTGYPFRAVAGGRYYLSETSGFRNVGSTNLSPALLAQLRQKTTDAPLMRSNVTVAVDTTLGPVALRDTDLPDLGYHYEPLDYLAWRWGFTNCRVSLRGGVVIGYCDDTGLWLQGGAALESEGTPLALNRFSDYRTVQEQPVKLGSWANSCGLPLNPARLEGGSPAPVRLRFTGFSRLARGGFAGYDLYAMGHWRFSQLEVQDCAFSGGVVMLYAGAGSGAGPMGLTNNLWQRQSLYVLGEPTLWLYNNLFKDCPAVSFDVWGGSSLLRDNVFDSVVLEALFDPPPIHSHNAYINVRDFRGNPARLEPPQPNDVVLAGFNYVAGLLGPFYQPTNSPLLNAGSRSAAEAGLYHFTVLTPQTKAGLLGNGQVSIGYHYVALDAQGQPLDTDGDGLPDYLEDVNGNGAGADDPTSWQSYNSAHGLVAGQGLLVFTPLK